MENNTQSLEELSNLKMEVSVKDIYTPWKLDQIHAALKELKHKAVRFGNSLPYEKWLWVPSDMLAQKEFKIIQGKSELVIVVEPIEQQPN